MHRLEAGAASRIEGDAPPVVGNFQLQHLAGERQADAALARPGVAGDVGESFERDAVGGDSDGGGQWRQRVGRRDRDAWGIAPAGGVLADRPDEAKFVQGGRPQRVDDAADVGHRLLRLRLEVRQQSVGDRVVAEAVARRRQLQAEAGQPRPEAVVQIAPETAALLFARGDQAPARALEVGGESRGVRRDPRLPRDLFQQAAIRHAEALSGGTRREDQGPDSRALVDERQPDEVGRRRSGAGTPVQLPLVDGGEGRTVPVIERDRRVRQFQRLGDRLHDGRKGRFRRERLLQPPTQAREDRLRPVALAIHQPVDAALEPLARRLEEDGHQAGSDERDRQAVASAEDRAEVA
ncbi:MAG: hypothetical protein M3R02_23865, partial [Chloroflexota bacterium]|nr:hypothetical protein [Chloroflexota bacterium]